MYDKNADLRKRREVGEGSLNLIYCQIEGFGWKKGIKTVENSWKVQDNAELGFKLTQTTKVNGGLYIVLKFSV